MTWVPDPEWQANLDRLIAEHGEWQGEPPKAMRNGLLQAVVSRDELQGEAQARWHISLAHADRVPTWDELKHGVYALIHDDVCMVLIFPRRTAPYVNIYDTCLHLYETEEELDR